LTHSSQTDPNAPRRSGKRRGAHGRAAGLGGRRRSGQRPIPVGDFSTLGEPAPPADVVARRQRRRLQAILRSLIPRTPVMWGLLVLMICVTPGAMRKMYVFHGDYQMFQAQADLKQEQLAALETQNEIAQKRKEELSSPKGREQLLIEKGYIPRNGRILLFPPDPEERRSAEISRNDLAPHPPSSKVERGSIFHQSFQAVGDWWSGVRRSGGAASGSAHSAAAHELPGR